ncbi:MAG: amino acid adenylation domain-containing protein [Myxococcota bacterium]
MTHVALTPVTFDPFAQGDVVESVASTGAQRELWTSAQLGDGANCAFNEALVLELRGAFDLQAFRSALQTFVDRHQALRGTFSDDGQLFIISAHREIDVPLEEGDDALRRALRDAVDRPFDLGRGPLFRARVIRVAPDRHHAVLTGHHTVFDGWSCAVLLEELGRLYTERTGGPAADLDAPASFVAYAEDEAAYARRPDFAETLAYWQRRFADGGTTFDLPADRARPPFRTFASDRIDTPLPPELTARLKAYATAQRTSFVSLMMAGFTAYLARLGGEADITVGMPAAGQIVFGEDALVGHCVNLLPIRVRVAGTFEAHVATTRGVLLDADEHRRLSFGRLLQALPPGRDPSRIPLTSIMFNVDLGMQGSGLRFGDLDTRFRTAPRSFESFELFVNLAESGGDMILEAQYNTALFDRTTIAGRVAELLDFYRRLLDAPTTPIADLDVVDTATRRRLLHDWNDTARDIDGDDTVVGLVAAAAARRGTEAAVRDLEGGALTFDALMRRAGGLATALRAAGVGPGDVVALCVARRVGAVVAVLGIMATGAAYLPIDPDLPSERIAFMLDDAKVAHAVLHRDLDGVLNAGLRRTVLEDVGESERLGPIDATPSGLAYLMYTSGSTGRPKGVMVPHRGVVNFLLGVMAGPALHPGARFVATTTFSFDVSGIDLYLPLIAGGTTVFASREVARDGVQLAALLERERATAMTATPATWRLLLEAGWRGNPEFQVYCGGEAFPPELAAPLLAVAGEVWNFYGPTEASIYATVARITDPEAPVTIGRPMANVGVYVLDPQRRLVPPGVPGELCLAGAGLADGYWGRDALTAERFIDNPIPDAPHPRLYRTGDEVTWRPDGTLRFLGRLDDQVKLRGYRIELGEIDSVLTRHPAVAQAASVVVEAQPGDQRLVAYLQWAADVRPPHDAALRQHLARSVPSYMVPSRFVPLDAFPLTPNGKVDKGALRARPLSSSSSSSSPPPREGPNRAGPSPPDPDRRTDGPPGRPPHPGGGETARPRTEAEAQICAIVGRLLDIPSTDVRLDETFFDLGGHSLLAIKLIATVASETEVTLALRDILLEPLGQLAQRLPATGGDHAAPRHDAGIPDAGSVDEAGAPPPPVMAAPGGVASFFFGPRYGAYHPPEGHSVRGAVLICGPIMQEYMRTHWALRRLAGQLQRRGFAVLRFDYRGCGDSQGELATASLAMWDDDVEAARDELRRRSGIATVDAVGLRLVATLVARAATKAGRFRRLALWDPIVDGGDALDRLQQLHRDVFADPNRFSRPTRAKRSLLGRLGRTVIAAEEELVGFPLPRHLERELRTLDLRGEVAQVARIFVARSLAIPGLDAWERALKSSSVAVDVAAQGEVGAWYDPARIEDALVAPRTAAALIASLTEGA